MSEQDNISEQTTSSANETAENGFVPITPITVDELHQSYQRKELKRILETVKLAAVSSDADTINAAWNAYTNVIGLSFNSENITPIQIEQSILQRTTLVPELQETYHVLSLGKEIYSMLNGEKNVNSLAIEDIIYRSKSFYAAEIIDNEQMARVYYNIGYLHCNYELSKGRNANIKTAAEFMDKYMLKSLSLTSNIELIRACGDNISDKSFSKKHEFTREACTRALKNKEQKDCFTRFQIYNTLAESCLEDKGSESLGYNKGDDRHKTAAIYYQAALRNAVTIDDTTKTLRNLSKCQSQFDKQAYFATRFKLAGYLSGRERVLEMMRLSSAKEISSINRLRALETAANELIDSDILAEEKKILWQNIKSNLEHYYGSDNKKSERLEQIDKKYFHTKKAINPKIVTVKSSKGNNHFGR